MVKIFQIYFKNEQKQALEPEYIPYFNENCTPFFENSVIKELVVDKKEADKCEYFGVVSHKLREKIDVTKKWSQLSISNRSLNEFTPQLFQSELFKNYPDAMSFQRHVSHDPISLADKFHPNFSKYFRFVLHENGYKWEPTAFKNIFYCNYFVAKGDLYQKYVKEMLYPCIETMESMPELWGNSRYPHELPAELMAKWEISHYPYHSFICERMFSYFAHIHNLKCLHY